LLTEVSNALALDGGSLIRSLPMSEKKAWAAVWSRAGATQVPSPHPAAATAIQTGVLICSCILPWRSARASWPPEDAGDVAAMTTAGLARLGNALLAAPGSVVWGGDWNHALDGREYVGSIAGRKAMLDLCDDLHLQVPTASLQHALPGLLSIDHIAVPREWQVTDARRIVTTANGNRLSDHDAYVVDVEL
jgi:hypothetical protein